MDAKEVKQYIKQSLFLLMENYDYDKISMNMIAEKAGVSRRTIYRNFENKQQILSYYMKEMVDDYYFAVQSKLENTANVIARSFQFISDNVKFFQLAYKNNLMANILDVLEQVVRKMIVETKSRKFKAIKKDDMDYYIAFVSGGCYRMLCQWLKEQNSKSPREMASMYRRIISDLDNRFVKEG